MDEQFVPGIGIEFTEPGTFSVPIRYRLLAFSVPVPVRYRTASDEPLAGKFPLLFALDKEKLCMWLAEWQGINVAGGGNRRRRLWMGMSLGSCCSL
ncbi:hypothetical protein Hanom_Chr10g00896351 [Helianthus anomalus]